MISRKRKERGQASSIKSPVNDSSDSHKPEDSGDKKKKRQRRRSPSAASSPRREQSRGRKKPHHTSDSSRSEVSQDTQSQRSSYSHEKRSKRRSNKDTFQGKERTSHKRIGRDILLKERSRPLDSKNSSREDGQYYPQMGAHTHRKSTQKNYPPFFAELRSVFRKHTITERSSSADIETILKDLYSIKPFCKKIDYQNPGNVINFTLIELARPYHRECIDEILPAMLIILCKCPVRDLSIRYIADIFNRLGALAKEHIELPTYFFRSQTPNKLLTILAEAQGNENEIAITLWGLGRLAKANQLPDDCPSPRVINILLNRFISLESTVQHIFNVIYFVGCSTIKKINLLTDDKNLLNKLLFKLVNKIKEILSRIDKDAKKTRESDLSHFAQNISIAFWALGDLLSNKLVSIKDVSPKVITELSTLFFNPAIKPSLRDVAMVVAAIGSISKAEEFSTQYISQEFIKKCLTNFNIEKAGSGNIADFIVGLSGLKKDFLKKYLPEKILVSLFTAFINKSNNQDNIHKSTDITRSFLSLTKLIRMGVLPNNKEVQAVLFQLLEVLALAFNNLLSDQLKNGSNRLINFKVKKISANILVIFASLNHLSRSCELDGRCFTNAIVPLLQILPKRQIKCSNFANNIVSIISILGRLTQLKTLAKRKRTQHSSIQNTIASLVESIASESLSSRNITSLLLGLARLARRELLPRRCLTTEILSGYINQFQSEDSLFRNSIVLYSLGIFADMMQLPADLNKEIFLELFNQLYTAEKLTVSNISMAIMGAGNLVLNNQTTATFMESSVKTWEKLLIKLVHSDEDNSVASSQVISMFLELMTANKIPENFIVPNPAVKKSSKAHAFLEDQITPDTSIALEELKQDSKKIAIPPICDDRSADIDFKQPTSTFTLAESKSVSDSMILIPSLTEEQSTEQDEENENVHIVTFDDFVSTQTTGEVAKPLVELKSISPIELNSSLDFLSLPRTLPTESSSAEIALTITPDVKLTKTSELYYPKSKSSWKKAIYDIRGSSSGSDDCVQLTKDLLDFSKTGKAKSGTLCEYEEESEVVIRNERNSEEKPQTVVSTVTTKISFGAQQNMMYQLNYLLGNKLNYKNFNEAYLEKQAIAQGGWFTGVISLSRFVTFDRRIPARQAKKEYDKDKIDTGLGHLVVFQYVSKDYNQRLSGQHKLPDTDRLMIFEPQDLEGGKISQPENLVIYSSLTQAYFPAGNEFFDIISFTALDSPLLYKGQDDSLDKSADIPEDDLLEEDLSGLEDIKPEESKKEEKKHSKTVLPTTPKATVGKTQLIPLQSDQKQFGTPPPISGAQPFSIDQPLIQLQGELPRLPSSNQNMGETGLPEGIQPIYIKHKYSMYLSITFALLLPRLQDKVEFKSMYLNLFGHTPIVINGKPEKIDMTIGYLQNVIKYDWQSKTLDNNTRLNNLLKMLHTRACARIDKSSCKSLMEAICQMTGASIEVSFIQSGKPKKTFHRPDSNQKIYLVEKSNSDYYFGLPQELYTALNQKKNRRPIVTSAEPLSTTFTGTPHFWRGQKNKDSSNQKISVTSPQRSSKTF